MSDITETSPSQKLTFEFHGNEMDYAKIYLKNLILSVLTLGIYSAWASVENRRYLYSQTSLAGTRFDFHGDPKRILAGRMFLVILAGIYFFGSSIYPTAGLIAYLAFLAGYPWLVVKGQAFRLRNTSYRGIRFGFQNDYKGSYLVHAKGLLCTIFTLGIMSPYFIYLTLRFRIERSRFGKQNFSFSGQPGFYMKLIFPYIGILLASMACAGIFGWVTSLLPLPGFLKAVIAGISFYGVAIAGGGYLYACVTNYNLDHAALGLVKIKSDLDTAEMAALFITNALLMVVTLGIATPWCLIRLMRYRLSKTSVIAPSMESFNQFEYDPQSLAEAKKGAWLDHSDFDFDV